MLSLEGSVCLLLACRRNPGLSGTGLSRNFLHGFVLRDKFPVRAREGYHWVLPLTPSGSADVKM